jgi:hypothetical protein
MMFHRAITLITIFLLHSVLCEALMRASHLRPGSLSRKYQLGDDSQANRIEVDGTEDENLLSEASVDSTTIKQPIARRARSAMSVNRGGKRKSAMGVQRGPRITADIENTFKHHTTYRKMNNYT